MKVAIITPHYLPVVRGNAVTVRRIEKNLLQADAQVAVFSLDALTNEEVFTEVAAFRPDLVHAFHGHSGGCAALQIRDLYGIDFVVTLTGTDVYQALVDHRSKEVAAVLCRASRVTVFHGSIRERLLQQLPVLAEKTVVIPQGVELPQIPCLGAGEFPFGAGKFNFLLPAGLRPVKNVLFPLAPLAALHERYPQVRLIFAGPVLDHGYAAKVMEALEGFPFAHYLGGIGHEAMGCLYNKADVVLNTSLFEGGMANSILEALAWGKPVLAADIAGNRSVITDGVTGFLYADERSFLAKAEKLIREPETRHCLGRGGQKLVQENLQPEKETMAYLALYQAMLTGNARG